MEKDILETIYNYFIIIAKKYRDFIREISEVGAKYGGMERL